MASGYPMNPPEVRAQRSRVFGAAADVYERARPGYPTAAVRDLLGGAPRDVLDLGAGTGKLTRAVLAAGHRVTVAEPDPEMLRLLRSVLPDVPAHEASAEALPFPAGSFDAVVAGQAAHWFDPQVALPEIARVLRPHGRIGLFWNVRDDAVPWIARFGELVGSEDAGDAMTGGDLRPWFGAATVTWYEHEHPLTVDQLVDLAHSRSTLLVLPDRERAERLQQVRELGESVATDGSLAMRYRLQVWAATRADR